MNLDDLNWGNTLNELDNFECKIEFLQSKIRSMVVCEKSMDTADYFKTLEGMVNEHKDNLTKSIAGTEINAFRNSIEMNNKFISNHE